MPDLFDGDPIPADVLNPGSKPDFPRWLGTHANERVLAIVRAVRDALAAEGVERVAALGFCFGARAAFDLAFAGEVQVVGVSHPSLLKIPEDLTVRRSLFRL